MLSPARRFHLRVTGALAVCSVLLVTGSMRAADKNDKKLVDVKIKDLKLSIPADWKQEDPSNNMRLSQFKIPAEDEDQEPAELVISSFKGGGGGIEPNLKRWVNEFSPEGRKVKVVKGESEEGPYYLSDLTGTYNKRVGPFNAGKTAAVPGSRALGVILQVPDKDSYFLKLTGPEKTVTAVEKAFKKSFGADTDKEEPYELK